MSYTIPPEALLPIISICYNHFAQDRLEVERQELHNHYVRYIIKCNRCGCRLGRISFAPDESIIGYKLGENFPECPECEEDK